MLRDFQIFEDFISSDSFRKLPQKEKEEFIASYNNLLEEEMDTMIQETKYYLQQKSISELFWKIYGGLEKDALKQKDDQWHATFGFRPLEILNKSIE